MENLKSFGGFIVLCVVVYLIWGFITGLGKYNGSTAEEWADEYYAEAEEVSELKEQVRTYQDALEEANYNINNANDQISNAKWAIGGDYYDLEYAIEELEEIENVYDPY